MGRFQECPVLVDRPLKKVVGSLKCARVGKKSVLKSMQSTYPLKFNSFQVMIVFIFLRPIY